MLDRKFRIVNWSIKFLLLLNISEHFFKQRTTQNIAWLVQIVILISYTSAEFLHTTYKQISYRYIIYNFSTIHLPLLMCRKTKTRQVNPQRNLTELILSGCFADTKIDNLLPCLRCDQWFFTCLSQGDPNNHPVKL